MNQTIKTNATIETNEIKEAKRRIPAILALALAIAAICGILTASEVAAGTSPVILEVKQSLTVTDAAAPSDASFGYMLAPVTAGAPLPAGGDASGYAFTLSGTAETEIAIPISAADRGVHSYTLRCTETPSAYYTADGNGGYRVEVYVYNVYSETEFSVTARRYREGNYDESDKNEGKEDFLLFTHTYSYTPPRPPGPNPPDPPGPADPTDPPPPTDPTDPAEPVTPSGPPAPANGGTVAPADNGNYIEFDENGTPLGEWRWDEDAGQWIYDEYPPLASLPQTGQLNWPVPALFLLGALLFLLGLRLNRREDERRVRRAGDARRPPIGAL